jgi:hypothetical protein
LLLHLFEGDEENIEMDFRRARRGVRAVAIHEPAAHEPAGRAGTRFDGHQPAAPANRGAAAQRVLRLSFPRNPVAVVQPHRAGVVAGGKRCHARARTAGFFRLASGTAKRLERISEEVDDKEMPPAKYALLHPEARLTASQREQLIHWADQEAARLKASGGAGTE